MLISRPFPISCHGGLAFVATSPRIQVVLVSHGKGFSHHPHHTSLPDILVSQLMYRRAQLFPAIFGSPVRLMHVHEYIALERNVRCVHWVSERITGTVFHRRTRFHLLKKTSSAPSRKVEKPF
jgi:hypothetical protein